MNQQVAVCAARCLLPDIKNSNKQHRNEKLNKQLQSFMYGIIADDNEVGWRRRQAV